MGTRHLICIWWKGEWYLAQYGQYDGYPEGQGLDIYKFLIVPGNIEKLKVGLEEHVYKVTSEEAWRMDTEMHLSLSARTAAKVLSIIANEATSKVNDDESKSKKTIPVYLCLDFANDGLFCEWAYVIDLDNEVLEIFGGAEHKTENHRFKDVGEPSDSVPGTFCSFTFAELAEMKTEEMFIQRIDDTTEQDEDEAEAVSQADS
ncbi:hypothetical protein CVT24_000507 [Panaeolus cyanescens]|uniref:Uncharacterized protein n=1 Tax=Panaeolus cyanescens TaxID=181874 RepID=A0A409V8E9_9AGAR|nr:hypothetical protein CVT24_000507 [Panaeolus cyanescens]